MRDEVQLVQITRREDGEFVEVPVWCVAVTRMGSPVTLCTGECFGYGEGSAEYKKKTVSRFRSKNACEDCVGIIQDLKAIRL